MASTQTPRLHKKDCTTALVRKLTVAGMLAFATGIAAPALARSEPTTRLVRCGDETCLLIAGRRQSAAAPVRINGHPVLVQGGRNWRTRLRVETVKQWSAPYARKIAVSSDDETTTLNSMQQASLPIGLLGHVPDLASLVITVH